VAVRAGEEDEGFGAGEFSEGLAAGAAGLRGGVVEVGDGDGEDADLWAVAGYGGGHGGLLGAGGEAEGGVFNVAAGDDGGVFSGEEEGCSYAEVAVGGVGVGGDGYGGFEEAGELGFCGCGVHAVSEATWVGAGVASGGLGTTGLGQRRTRRGRQVCAA